MAKRTPFSKVGSDQTVPPPERKGKLAPVDWTGKGEKNGRVGR